MASEDKEQEIMRKLSKHFPRIDRTDQDLVEDWGRVFDRLTDPQMDVGMDRVLTQHATGWPPTPGEFFALSGGGEQKVSKGRLSNPWFHWCDPKTGMDWADPSRNMPKNPPSDPEQLKRAKARAMEIMGVMRTGLDTPLAKINRVRRAQGQPLFKSQVEWDAHAMKMKETPHG